MEGHDDMTWKHDSDVLNKSLTRMFFKLTPLQFFRTLDSELGCGSVLTAMSISDTKFMPGEGSINPQL
jgi:hypothetical protein